MKPALRIYVDTSVIGGLIDEEFADDTRPLWQSFVSGRYLPVLSTLTMRELSLAPLEVQRQIDKIPDKYIEIVDISDRTHELAGKYLVQGALPPKMENDALHIALATIARVDVLVSWNFKHVVNINKIHIYNGVNLTMGYLPIEIRTPKEVIDDE